MDRCILLKCRNNPGPVCILNATLGRNPYTVTAVSSCFNSKWRIAPLSSVVWERSMRHVSKLTGGPEKCSRLAKKTTNLSFFKISEKDDILESHVWLLLLLWCTWMFFVADLLQPTGIWYVLSFQLYKKITNNFVCENSPLPRNLLFIVINMG